jgi:uncharacterized delta-60 repeat protein
MIPIEDIENFLSKPRHLAFLSFALAPLAIWVALATMTSDFHPDAEVTSTTLQSDGRAVLGGKFSTARIARLNTDGTVDPTFGASWFASGFNGDVAVVRAQSDDRILVGGAFTLFDVALAGGIARLNLDGSLDQAFMTATGTGFDDAVTSIALDSQGKIWVGGKFTSYNGTSVPHLARLNSDGTLDPAFQPGGGFDGNVLTLTTGDASGQIIAAGDFTRFNGSPAPHLAQIAASGALITQNGN